MRPIRYQVVSRVLAAIASLSACAVVRQSSAEYVVVAPAAAPAAAAKPEATADDEKGKPTGENKAPAPTPAADKPAAQPAQEKKAENKQEKDAPRRVVRPRPIANAAVQSNLKTQIRRQFAPLLKAELSFAIRTAGLTADERKALIEAGKKWFDKYVADATKNADPQRQQMLLQGAQMIQIGGGPVTPNPRNEIRAAMPKLAASTLPKDKVETYTTEFNRREDFYRDAAIDNMITCLDDRVILSPQQRGEIADALAKHWKDITKPQLEAFIYAGSMLPAMPTEKILPVLTPAQKDVLQKLNSVNRTTFFGDGFFGDQTAVLDDIDLGEPPEDDKPNIQVEALGPSS